MPKPKQPINLRYPFSRIDESDDYLKIEVINYRPPGIGAREGLGFRIKSSDDPDSDLTKLLATPSGTILLPMPQDIGDTRGVEWGEDRMNSLAAAAVGGAANVAGSSDFLSSAAKTVLGGFNRLKDVATTGDVQQGLSAYFGAQAVNALIGQENIDPFSVINRGTGSVLNQNQELLFRGVTLRSHSFSWTFTPRFKEEAEQVKAIIKAFKSSMSAKKTGAVADDGKGVFIQAPDVYRLRYYSGSKQHPFLNTFKICALSSMSVSYTASGTYATYADGTPIQTSMSLVFQELTPIYAEDYNTTQGEIGVGY
jgi:hypothetical protein